jgi:parallel beta-helix repeat protein
VDNTWGITLTADADFNNVTGNQIAGNKYGIYIFGSSNNLLFHNNFVNNRRHVNIDLPYDVDDAPQSPVPSAPPSVNAWDNGKEGNFWSNYTGTDADGDGVGDTPHVIDADNVDRCPLSEPMVAPSSSEIQSEPETTHGLSQVLQIICVSVTAALVFALGVMVYFKKHNRGQPM